MGEWSHDTLALLLVLMPIIPAPAAFSARLFRPGRTWQAPGFPSFEMAGEVFLPRLVQPGHDVGMLRSEPILKLIQGLDG
jgi:hypothetical protein